MAFPDNEHRPAFDVVLQAEAGFMYMNGDPEGEPTKMPVALIDLLAAHQLKEAILCALLHRASSGEGLYVETSLMESAIASLANQASNWLMGNHIATRMGSSHPNIAPYGEVYYSLDKKPLVLAVGTNKQFAALCQILGLDIAENPLYQSNWARLQNRASLTALLQAAIAQFTRNELMIQLEKMNVPAGSIRNMQEVFEQKAAADMILEDKLPNKLGKRVKTVAFRMTK